MYGGSPGRGPGTEKTADREPVGGQPSQNEGETP